MAKRCRRTLLLLLALFNFSLAFSQDTNELEPVFETDDFMEDFSAIIDTEPATDVFSEPEFPDEIGDIQIPDSEYAKGIIKKYIEKFTTNAGKKQLFKTLDNGEIYRLYIRQELAKRSMPFALEYLAFVESDYTPLAVSRSGAKGMWQFMDNSISPYLKKTEWVDERLDPWLSTDAALSKLQDNYKMFNDWPIAIAAYNCGAGAMKKILKKAKEQSFWYISEKKLLQDQSVQYVPKLLAICELATNSTKYGIEVPEMTTSTRYADFDYLTVKESISLKRLESEMRLQEGTLKKLNPSLLYDLTPPSSEFKIRLPSGLETSGQVALHNIQTDSFKPAKFMLHHIVSGDTLSALAKKNGTTVDAICNLNGIKKTDVLSLGKILYIPIK